MRIFPVCLIAMGILFAAAAYAEDGDATTEEPKFGTTNPDMLAAIAKARETLDGFLEQVRHPEPDMSTFKLKILVRDGTTLETFWVTPFQILDEGFEGVIANKPAAVGNVSLGDIVVFTRDDVLDWGYVRGGHQVGSFTVCALFRYMHPDDVEYYRRFNGFDC